MYTIHGKYALNYCNLNFKKMKKLFLLTSITFLLLSTACTKTYTCGCTDGTPNNIVHTEEIKADNKDEAREKCHSVGIECEIL